MSHLMSTVRHLRCTLVGKNPLVRPSDRSLARLAVALSAIAILAVPVVAAAAATLYTSILDTARHERNAHTEVTAVLQEDAPRQAATADLRMQSAQGPKAAATWSGPGLGIREGVVPVPHGSSAGSEFGLWIDQDGAPTRSPLTPDRAATATVLSAIGTWTAFAAALVAVYSLVRTRHNRRHDEEWSRQWHQFDERSGIGS